jgi:hypothetical protein
VRDFRSKKRCPCPSTLSSLTDINTSTTININGYYQNCHGLLTKHVNFNFNTSCFNYVFIALTETYVFHFFTLNSNLFPNNASVTLSLVQNLPYCVTLNIFGVSLEKNRSSPSYTYMCYTPWYTEQNFF